jgi:hypothetical protein
MVPIGERAIAWMGKYVSEVRPALVMPPDNGVLFFTQEGEALNETGCPAPEAALVSFGADRVSIQRFRRGAATNATRGNIEVQPSPVGRRHGDEKYFANCAAPLVCTCTVSG